MNKLLQQLLLIFATTSSLLFNSASLAAPISVYSQKMYFEATPGAHSLVCTNKPTPPKTANTQEISDPLSIPDQDIVSSFLEDPIEDAAPTFNREINAVWQKVPPGTPYKIALWGDSHMAAGYFTQELIKLLNISNDQLASSFIPATMNRSGVKIALKKTCVSSGWRYESAHTSPESARAPGPSLVSLVSSQEGSTLDWDLTSGYGSSSFSIVKLYFNIPDTGLKIGITVDEGEEQTLTLNSKAGPAFIDVINNQPISLLKLRLIEGSIRFHGVGLDVPSIAKLQLDLFAYPGSTVRGWQNSDQDYLKGWFRNEHPYNLVILSYGTNEGNVKPFDASVYKAQLTQSVANFKNQFPSASCLLLGPGDRGILIKRSRLQKIKVDKHKRDPHRILQAKHPSMDIDYLLNYSLVHEKIIKIQSDIAHANGCYYWDMYSAMGGRGSSYKWAHQTPPLMAHDLIHFTALGYQKLADDLFLKLGWSETAFWGN